MPESIEATTEALPTSGITFGPIPSTVVFSLAAYGAQDLTRKGIRKAKSIRDNRKAKKAAKKTREAVAAQQ